MVVRLKSTDVTAAGEPHAGFSPEAAPDSMTGDSMTGAPPTAGIGLQSREFQSQNHKKMVAADVALDWVLQEIVQQARLATTATGAFVCGLKGQKIISHATSGSTAGEFIAYLNRDRRMVDACLRERDARRCRDSEASSELEASACRYLGARSVVMIPVLGETGEKPGVFGVFSPQADAFSDANVIALKSLSRRIAAAMAQVERGINGFSGEANSSVRRDTSKPIESYGGQTRAADFIGVLRRPALGVLAIFLIVAAGWGVMRVLNRREAQTANAPTALSQPGYSVPAESAANTPPHADPAPPTQPFSAPSAPSANPAPSTAPAHSSTFSPTVDHPAPDAVRAKPSQNSPATAVKSNPSVVPNAKPVTHPATTHTIVKKVPAGSKSDTPELEIENDLDDAGSPTPSAAPSGRSGKSSSRSIDTLKTSNQPRTLSAPAQMAPAASTSINPGSSSSANASLGAPREAIRITRDPEPPRATLTTPTPPLNQNAAPAAATPAGAVMIEENAALRRVVQKVQPDYPDEAMGQNVQGPVMLDVVVSKDGQVESAKPVSGDARLQAAAAKAVRQWQFAPLIRDGHFVSFESHITVTFTMP